MASKKSDSAPVTEDLSREAVIEARRKAKEEAATVDGSESVPPREPDESA